MIRKILAAAFICCVTVTTLSAQRTNSRNAGRSEDRGGTAPERDGVMDSHRFYNTPYRSRNSGTYGPDRHILSFGLGFPNTLYNNYEHYSSGVNRFGPIMAKYEFAIRDEVGIGGVIDAAFATHERRISGIGYRDKIYGFGISPMGYYHFNKLIPVRRLDVYGGVGINISSILFRDGYTGDRHSEIDVLPALVAGARYYFRPSFAPYFELGRTNYSYANIGISLNL